MRGDEVERVVGARTSEDRAREALAAASVAGGVQALERAARSFLTGTDQSDDAPWLSANEVASALRSMAGALRAAVGE